MCPTLYSPNDPVHNSVQQTGQDKAAKMVPGISRQGEIIRAILCTFHHQSPTKTNCFQTDEKETPTRSDDGRPVQRSKVMLLHRDERAQAGLQEICQSILLLCNR